MVYTGKSHEIDNMNNLGVPLFWEPTIRLYMIWVLGVCVCVLEIIPNISNISGYAPCYTPIYGTHSMFFPWPENARKDELFGNLALTHSLTGGQRVGSLLPLAGFNYKPKISTLTLEIRKPRGVGSDNCTSPCYFEHPIGKGRWQWL